MLTYRENDDSIEIEKLSPGDTFLYAGTEPGMVLNRRLLNESEMEGFVPVCWLSRTSTPLGGLKMGSAVVRRQNFVIVRGE